MWGDDVNYLTVVIISLCICQIIMYTLNIHNFYIKNFH